LEQKQEELKRLQARVNSRLDMHKQFYKKIQARDSHKTKLETLKKEYKYQKGQLDSDKTKVTSWRSSILPRVQKLKEAELQLQASEMSLKERRAHLQEEKSELETQLCYIGLHNSRLIQELGAIYKIVEVEKNVFAINGFVLPDSDSFNGHDDEKLAIALGYVCHIIFLLAKYLEVPLRYPMTPMCSRSFIRDDILNQGKYQLYLKGVEKTQFQYGVFLLNKNLEQLMHSQRLEVNSLRSTLPNLQKLLQSTPTNTHKSMIRSQSKPVVPAKLSEENTENGTKTEMTEPIPITSTKSNHKKTTSKEGRTLSNSL